MKEKTEDKKNLITYIIFGLLVISAFANGSLYTKVKMLEKGGGTAQAPSNNQAAAQPQGQPAPPAKADIKVSNNDFTLGSPNAKVVIVEYTDYQCPFCKRYYDTSYQDIKKEYIDSGKARLVVREYPLTMLHANAQKAAEAAQCAGDQKKYFEYHDKLFTTQDTWANNSGETAVTAFKQYAQQLGLNTANFSACLDTGKFAQKITDSIAEGTKYGVQGTPAFFINGNLLSGAQPFASFKSVIDSELK